MLLINLSYTCVIDSHFQYEIFFTNFIRDEYRNIFPENPELHWIFKNKYFKYFF